MINHFKYWRKRFIQCLIYDLILYKRMYSPKAHPRVLILNHYQIWFRHEKIIQMTTNKPSICEKIFQFVYVTRLGGMSHMSAYSFLIFFKITYLFGMPHFDPKPHLNLSSGCGDMNNSIKFKNKVKHKNLSPFKSSKLKINIPNIRLILLIISQIQLLRSKA